ncbi:hypothetical protein EZS27_018029 [termite gut metagenome]|uniref:Uncharacterized protein n=1 Tax=termite gut metagenome TaxID=433724 RepID=A0A5J4RJ15_9ZZZZ
MSGKFTVPPEILKVTRPPHTIIKMDGKGHFYVQEWEIVRLAGESKPVKIMGGYIGKIEDGVFVPNEKYNRIENKEYPGSAFISLVTQSLHQELVHSLGQEGEDLYATALLCYLNENTDLANVKELYDWSYLSEVISSKVLSQNKVDDLFASMEKRQEHFDTFLQTRIPSEPTKLIIDETFNFLTVDDQKKIGFAKKIVLQEMQVHVSDDKTFEPIMFRFYPESDWEKTKIIDFIQQLHLENRAIAYNRRYMKDYPPQRYEENHLLYLIRLNRDCADVKTSKIVDYLLDLYHFQERSVMIVKMKVLYDHETMIKTYLYDKNGNCELVYEKTNHGLLEEILTVRYLYALKTPDSVFEEREAYCLKVDEEEITLDEYNEVMAYFGVSFFISNEDLDLNKVFDLSSRIKSTTNYHLDNKETTVDKFDQPIHVNCYGKEFVNLLMDIIHYQVSKALKDLNIPDPVSVILDQLTRWTVVLKQKRWYFNCYLPSANKLIEQLNIETRWIDPVNYRYFRAPTVALKRGRKPDPNKAKVEKEKKSKGRPRTKPVIDYELHPELKKPVGRPKKVIDLEQVVEKKKVGRPRKAS